MATLTYSKPKTIDEDACSPDSSQKKEIRAEAIVEETAHKKEREGSSPAPGYYHVEIF